MAYSKSPRPYRRYSVRMLDGALYEVRAHDAEHAKTLADRRYRRDMAFPRATKTRVSDVYEGTVRRATS